MNTNESELVIGKTLGICTPERTLHSRESILEGSRVKKRTEYLECAYILHRELFFCFFFSFFSKYCVLCCMYAFVNYLDGISDPAKSAAVLRSSDEFTSILPFQLYTLNTRSHSSIFPERKTINIYAFLQSFRVFGHPEVSSKG